MRCQKWLCSETSELWSEPESDFKFLVLSTQKPAMAKYVSEAQKVFLLGHGFYLLPKADFRLAFLWMPINH